MRILLIILGIIFPLSYFSSLAVAEKVTFPSAKKPPTKFQIQQAKAKGIEPKGLPAVNLTGYLSKPATSGKTPAVIVMGTGQGIRQTQHDWADSLADEGYLALIVDSFGSRGFKDYRDGFVDSYADAIGAYDYLIKRKDVNPNNIAIVGFSLGGTAIFKLFAEENALRPAHVKFKVGAALYPKCDTKGVYTTPFLIFYGGKDGLARPENCRALQESNPENLDFVFYPEATHFFDFPEYAETGTTKTYSDPKPMWSDITFFHREATQDSKVKTLEFLRKHLSEKE